MKYRSITLNGNKKHKYTLIKYTDAYKQDLHQLRMLNNELANCVEQCPKIYSELSEHQSYMIYDGKHCVGAIYIGTSTTEKDLELKIWFDQKYFRSYTDIVTVIEQLTDSLGLYFYDKENIEIELINDLDLSQFNGIKFKKKVYDGKLTTYICSNKRNSILIPAILNEMSQTEENLIKWKQSWTQKFHMCSYLDYDHELDGLLLEEYEKGIVSVNEMFYKAESISWHDIDSMKNTRNIDFSRDGKIHFNKYSKDLNGINYDFNYDVLGDGFNFEAYGVFNKKHIKIDRNSYYTKINLGSLNVLQDKESKRKRISYITPIVNNSSIEVELWTNEEKIIERCYIDFRTHKGNGKVNGLYALRILPQYNVCALNYISRDGLRYSDFSKMLFENNEQLYSTIVNENLTFELIDELIKKVIPIINCRATSSSRKIIDQQNESVISNIVDIETQVINFIKQIKGEIPLPRLQTNVEKFVVENDRSNTENKEKRLIRHKP